MTTTLTRRGFLVGVAGGALAAASARRVLGANDRISIGLLGCGGRSLGLLHMAYRSAADMNAEITAVCDLWTHHRERAAGYVEQAFRQKPRAFKYHEDLLELRDLDAVMIATGDFQHAKLLVDVVRAGKDCYCEKPMANVLEEAKLARDTVLASRQVVQMGSQWVSDPWQNQVREIVRSGQLGRITRIAQTWNKNEERWHVADNPNVKRIREEDTDWKRWLLGKPDRPFDPWSYFEFRIKKDFSSGIPDQWMSHGSGLVHFYMDEDIPETMVASGGIYQWPEMRENPDTFSAVATYRKGFVHTYQTQFGNSFGSFSAIMGTQGTLWSEGGEGSQIWTLTPDGGLPTDPRPRPGHVPVAEERRISVPGQEPLIQPSDDSKEHYDDWITAMRARRQPNGDIHTGFKHSVAVIMAARAYREGRKLYWDPVSEQILDHPPA
jgi:predicted dehydrogenase